MTKAKSGFEILGIGAPVIDYRIEVSEEFLRQIPGKKGGMVAVDYSTFTKILSDSALPPMLIAGGSCANTIRGLAGFGHKCAFLGKIGADLPGKKFQENLSSLEIKSFLKTTSTPTAQVICLITSEGERTMRSFLGASQEFSEKDLDASYFDGVKLVHIEGYQLLHGAVLEKAMKLAKDAGALVSFDVGSFELASKYKDRIIDLLVKYVDIVFANEDELFSLLELKPEKGCRVLRDLCEAVVILMGVNGCWVGSKEHQIKCEAFPVKPLDTTGAGDFFASGFLHGYLQGASLERCAYFGARMGEAIVQVHGGCLPVEAWSKLLKDL